MSEYYVTINPKTLKVDIDYIHSWEMGDYNRDIFIKNEDGEPMEFYSMDDALNWVQMNFPSSMVEERLYLSPEGKPNVFEKDFGTGGEALKTYNKLISFPDDGMDYMKLRNLGEGSLLYLKGYIKDKDPTGEWEGYDKSNLSKAIQAELFRRKSNSE